jgi:hypothetical protein
MMLYRLWVAAMVVLWLAIFYRVVVCLVRDWWIIRYLYHASTLPESTRQYKVEQLKLLLKLKAAISTRTSAGYIQECAASVELLHRLSNNPMGKLAFTTDHLELIVADVVLGKPWEEIG